MTTGFRFPGGDARTTILGSTGSGKSTNGVWMLAHQRFDRRPWVAIDFKREALLDAIGFPPLQQIELSDGIPKKSGLYVLCPRPDQDEALDAWLWKVWARENVGLYIDEAALMPANSDAFRAILQQGRSKRIPVIACSQRPVSVVRGVFSEASYFCIYRMADRRDYRVVEGFVPGDLSEPLPAYHWRWYDVARDRLLYMAPVPKPRDVADQLRAAIPEPRTWHPFKWTARPTGREKVKAA